MTPTRDRHAPPTAAPARDAPELRSIVRWLSWGSLLVPVVGWVYGILQVWGYDRLRTRDKLVATLLFPGGWAGAFAAAWVISRESSGYCYEGSFGTTGAGSPVTESGCAALGVLPGWAGLPLTIAVLAAAAIGPVYVRRRGRRLDAAAVAAAPASSSVG